MMNAMTPRHSRNPSSTQRQRGVALFVALIGMVVLSLAAVALMRSVDSGTSIAGNLAFKQASIGPINYAIEQANYQLFDAPIGSRVPNQGYTDAAPFNYFADLQAGETTSGIPAGLYGSGYTYPAGFQTYTDAVTGYQVRWMIERMCARPYQDDPLLNAGLVACDLLVPKVSLGRTTMKLQGLVVPPQPLYRVTVRVDGPANTTTYAQAMLR